MSDKLRAAFERGNQVLRTAWQIAERNGERTNWEGFRKQLEEVLNEQHRIMYPELYATSPPSREWLKKMANAEDAAGSVSVGGMAADLELIDCEPDIHERTIMNKLRDCTKYLREHGFEVVPQASGKLRAAFEAERQVEEVLSSKIASSLAAKDLPSGDMDLVAIQKRVHELCYKSWWMGVSFGVFISFAAGMIFHFVLSWWRWRYGQ